MLITGDIEFSAPHARLSARHPLLVQMPGCNSETVPTEAACVSASVCAAGPCEPSRTQIEFASVMASVSISYSANLSPIRFF